VYQQNEESVESDDIQHDEFFYEYSEQLDIPKISIEILKKGKSYENISDEDAETIIESLYQLSIITYKILQI